LSAQKGKKRKMAKPWLYSLKKDDFSAIANALGIKLEGLVEEMGKTLSSSSTRPQTSPNQSQFWKK